MNRILTSALSNGFVSKILASLFSVTTENERACPLYTSRTMFEKGERSQTFRQDYFICICQMHDSKIVEVVTCSKKRGTEKVPKRSNPKAHSLCTMLRTRQQRKIFKFNPNGFTLFKYWHSRGV